MRKLTPELLDHLPADDPGAIRSRADLRRINRFMGNEAWILSHIPAASTRIIELGSGEGSLLRRIHQHFPKASIEAYDLAPRPADLPEAIEWRRGDLLENPPDTSGATVIANLFLHHFTDPQLAGMGQWLKQAQAILINEPQRARLPQLLGKLAYPFIHPITRHDMRVSIEAGFIEGEIPTALGLDASPFAIRESSTWRGSQRVLGFAP